MEIGEKYNRLTVVEFLPDYKARFICECGNEVIAPKSQVKTGKTKSCGCYKRDIDRLGWSVEDALTKGVAKV